MFDAQPVIGKRIVVLNFQLLSEEEFDLVITGHTWPYRQRLDSLGVRGGYTDAANSPDAKKKYFRVLKDMNLNDDAEERITTMLDTAFKRAVMQVTIDQQPVAGSKVESFLAKLRRIHHLFFK